ncbi:MAG: DUF3386 domain-containing protein [Oculatellaceae cyanobacterium bins.114]|nr:DUF3386 domain-containing protein [Oculatellaceae cyanobacterium bins.114]
MTEQLEARDLFRAAYENRYTWDKNFPGYTADVTVRQGTEIHTAKVRVNENLSTEVSEIDDEKVKQSISEQVWEIAIHRIRRSFEETHGKNTFSYGETDDTGAVEILMGGKAEGDRYKVRKNEVCFVHRHIHGTVVTINTFGTHHTSEGYLSHRYHSVYHDAKTGEQKGESEFEDNYEQVDDYYILTQRVIRAIEGDKQITTEFTFSNVTLLQPAVV